VTPVTRVASQHLPDPKAWRGLTYMIQDGQWTHTPWDDGTVMVLRTPLSPAFDTAERIACHWRPGEVW